MAIIATNNQQADVKAMGSAMNATMAFSGAMFEMLATVYVYILMAAVREPIQNGADAVRRKGMRVADGVMVHLPTADNPMITVIDQGSGMTKAFMEDPVGGYLSFGSSTKAGDNGAAGGLGVGRWAAYGYIRECYVVTCNAEDMVERTYFQFQGPNGTPQVQLASEVPGKVTGTRVFFPVKESDIDEALRAIAWLREVMQLTMGDTFSVDSPAALPKVLPDFCGTVLDLDEVDPGLKGIRLYPMQGDTLKYGRQGLQAGSLVVLTNKEAGVGGLPFHVQSPTDNESVFAKGMIVEIPMSFGIPFMPSREELKYTDDVNALLRRIDEAAERLIVKKVKELYDSPRLEDKAVLSNLIGNTESWHWFAHGARNAGRLLEPLRKVTGGDPWRGSLKVPSVAELRASGLQVKSTSANDPVLREAFSSMGYLAVSGGARSADVQVTFVANKPIRLAVNDLKTGGTARFRAWLNSLAGSDKFIYLTAENMADAKTAADAINATFGNALEVVFTSSMPEVARTVVGSKVITKRSRVGTLTYHCLTKGKQDSEAMAFETFRKHEGKRIWISKDGGKLGGFKEGTVLADLFDWSTGDLKAVLTAVGVSRLYLLSPKQATELTKAQAEAQAEGLFDLTSDDFDEEAGGLDAYHAVCGLKSWASLEEELAHLVASADIQAVLEGKKVRSVKECWELNSFCTVMAKSPRMELTGTKVDKAFTPHIDFLTANVSLYKDTMNRETFNRTCEGLMHLAKHMDVQADDPEERKELVNSMARLREVGHLDYNNVWAELTKKFPLLRTLTRIGDLPKESVDHACHALAALYR